MIAERPGDVSLRVDMSIMRRGDGERKEIKERTDIMQSLTPKSRCPRTSCWYANGWAPVMDVDSKAFPQFDKVTFHQPSSLLPMLNSLQKVWLCCYLLGAAEGYQWSWPQVWTALTDRCLSARV